MAPTALAAVHDHSQNIPLRDLPNNQLQATYPTNLPKPGRSDAHETPTAGNDSPRHEVIQGSSPPFESPDEEARSRRATALPPIDGGRRAWVFVFCGFIIETLTWGFPYSYGVLQEYYLTHPPFDTASEQMIAATGNVSIGLMLSIMPFAMMFLRRWPGYMRTIQWASLIVGSGSLALSSFATKAWHLVLLQGVLVGLTGGIIFAPIVVWVNEWFVEKRGLASSIIFSGACIGGAVFPLLIHFLLSRTGGFQWTLRILALIIFLLGGVALLGVAPRVPVAPRSIGLGSDDESRRRTRPDYGFLKTPLFIALTFTIVVQSVAFFPVSLYIPSYSAAIGLSTFDGTMALTAFNLARVLGQVILGELTDKMMYTHLIILSSTLSALSAFLMWGFAHNLSSVFAFVVFFGVISGGFSSVGTPASVDLVGTDPAQSGIVFGFLLIFRGVGVMIGPATVAVLHSSSQDSGNSERIHSKAKFGGYGFTLVEIFVGSMMAATAVGGFAVMFLRKKRSFGSRIIG